MSAEDNTPEETPEEERTEFNFAYRDVSGLKSEGERNILNLYGNMKGASKIAWKGKIKDPALFRTALTALYDVVKSDQRFVPRDRSAYLAYKTLKKESAGMQAWEARQAYFDWLERNDPQGFLTLDPVISVFPEEIFLEVFSKDEGVYASLALEKSLFETEGEIVYGTTNIEFSQELFESLQRMRTYRETILTAENEEVELETKSAEGEKSGVIEKKAGIPSSWLRGFLQIQSAGIFKKTGFKIAPIDMYNVLRHLRLNADQKKKGRAIRVQLTPGEYPRLILEPWELCFETSAEKYQGRKSEVIRLWGRRRLKLLESFLPLAREIQVYPLGSGLPSFLVLRAGPVRYTLCLTGFTAGNWAQTVNFDLLLPRDTEVNPDTDTVLKYLAEKRSAGLEEISADLNLEKTRTLKALQTACQSGLLIYDLELFRFRPLERRPLDLETLRFRNRRERMAYDLLGRNAVRLEKENQIYGAGLELTGLVKSEREKEEFRSTLLIDDEGRARKARCSCTFYRKNKLKQGPCEHMIALRIHHTRQAVRRDESAITMETRTYARRFPEGEQIYRLSLERREVKKYWGLQGSHLRKQCLVFNSPEEARDAYLTQVSRLEARGYLDTTR